MSIRSDHPSESDSLLYETHLPLDMVLATYNVFFRKCVNPHDCFPSLVDSFIPLWTRQHWLESL